MIDKHTVATYLERFTSLTICWAENWTIADATRGVTHGALFGIGYALLLGPVFGLASGATRGFTLAWEYSRASQNNPRPGFLFELVMSAIRGCGFVLNSASGSGYVSQLHSAF